MVQDGNYGVVETAARDVGSARGLKDCHMFLPAPFVIVFKVSFHQYQSLKAIFGARFTVSSR